MPLHSLLIKKQNIAFDYVFVDDRSSTTFENLFDSLSDAFPSSTISPNHLYYVKTSDDLIDFIDAQLAYCSDQIRSTTLLGTQSVQKLLNYTVAIVLGSIAFIMIIAIIAAIVYFHVKSNREKQSRLEFIRQVMVNEQYEFDFIRKLWQVDEDKIECNERTVIGKGSQSIVYKGINLYVSMSKR